MKFFTIHHSGQAVKVRCEIGTYIADDTLAISVVREDGKELGDLTRNIGSRLASRTAAFVNPVTKSEKWTKELADQIGMDTGVRIMNGGVVYPLYKFDVLKLF